MKTLKVDGALLGSPGEAAAAARHLEAAGYAGAFTFEGPRDPFLPLALAAGATRRIRLATAIAVAFSRSPMLLAQTANDLQQLSQGRFVLGLGSQIRPHIERRFSMPWSRPAARMRELVAAVRAIWRCWNEGEPLRFEGEFYTHTLMTPFFHPGPNPYGPPPLFVAGVGPQMTAVAGEVGDGFFVHPFHTAESVRAVTLPALERGLARAGRARKDLEICAQLLLVTGDGDEAWRAADDAVRAQIAFYASTPAYRCVLEQHGQGDLQPELNRLSKEGGWAEMAALVDDSLLEQVAVRAEPADLAERIRARCAGYADRVSLVTPWRPEPEAWADLVQALSAGGAGADGA